MPRPLRIPLPEKFLYPLGVLLVTALVGVWLYTAFPRAGMRPEGLYAYYPESAMFYLEWAPDQRVVARLFQMMNQHPQGFTRATELSPPDESLSKTITQTFQPVFSIGLWRDTTHAVPGDYFLSQALVILPLRENLSTPDLITRFRGRPSDFRKQTHQGVELWLSTQSRLALTQLDGKLLVANSPKALRAVVAHRQRQNPTVLDAPEVRDRLAQLPFFRQGTVILRNGAYLRKALAMKDGVPEVLTRRVGELAEVMPLVLGSLESESDLSIRGHFLAPLHWQTVSNPLLQDALVALGKTQQDFRLQQATPEDASALVSLVGVDAFFRLYAEFLASPGERRNLEAYHRLLLPFGIKLKQDIINLWQGESGFVFGESHYPAVLLSNNRTKQATVDKLVQFMALGILPFELKTQQVGPTVVQTLSVRGRSQSVSVARLGDELLALAPPPAVEALVQVRNREKHALQASRLFQTLFHSLHHRGNALFYVNLNPTPHTALRGATVLQGAAGSIAITQAEEGPVLEGRLAVQLTPDSSPRKK